MSLPNSLTGLTTREAITDAIYRCIDGFDFPDAALFDSSCTPDAVFDLGGFILEGRDAIHKGCYDYIASIDTTHFLTNMRINVKPGEREASVTCHALAQHFRSGEGRKPGSENYLGGSLYQIDMVKDESDGLWRWKYWKLSIIWGQGNTDIVTTEARKFQESRS